MSQKRIAKNDRTAQQNRRVQAHGSLLRKLGGRRLIAITACALTVILGLSLALVSWGKPFGMNRVLLSSGSSVVPPPVPSPSIVLSKEYIYAGDRLVAAERPVPVNSPPSVSITAPAAGATFMAPATVALSANAADSDGTISKVEFYQGASLIGTVTSAPFNFSWTNVSAGSYSLTARTTDNRGAITTSAAVNITVNNPAPTVSITSPSGGTTVVAPANVAINASASTGAGTISKVEFYQGASLIGTVTSAPFNFNWNNVGAGNYSLTAKATASTGTTTTSSAVNLIVNAPPSVSITAPAAGATFMAPATVALSANAADSDGTISKVEFYQGASLIGTVTSAPFNFSWTNVSAGSYSLTARTTDNRGATTTSAAVNITVNNPAPTVSITSPSGGTTVVAPANVAISASASTGVGTISKVEFYQGASLIGTVTSAPFNFNWNNVGAGNYSLTAKATASTGTTTTSSAVNLIVNAPPSVSITAPANNATFAAPATVALSASAADSDGTISKVEFYQGASLIGTVTSAPFNFNWTNVGAGSYSLTARTTDNRGAITTSAAVNITVNNPAPTVSITSPSSGTTVVALANVAISASASVGVGTISKVEFYQGASLIGTVTSAPFNFNWNNVSAGNYSLTAKATASTSTTATSSPVNVIVNAPPSVSITAPANNATFAAPATVALSASAADSDGTISKVEFYQGASLIGTVTSAPFNFSWTNVGTGSYSLTARATDNRGAITTSAAVNITVNNPAPTVNITLPVNGLVVTAPGNIAINASASTSVGTISKVEFYQGATLIGTVTTSPFSFNWINVPAGNYSLTAKATASTGATATSSAINVIVNSPPSVSITAPANNATFTAPATVVINTNAADPDGSVTKVEFFDGATKLGETLTAPFNFNWTQVASGSHSLSAKATDNRGASTSSTVVTISVSQPSSNAQDTFTSADGVELSQHIGEIGAIWTQPSYANGSKNYIYSNRLTHDSNSARNIYYTSAQPPIDCYVQATISKMGLATGTAGLVLRLNPSSQNYYYATYDTSTSRWAIFSNVNGTNTQLGSWPDAFFNGQSRVVRFQASGNNLILIIDGTTRVSVTSADHSAAGRAGIVMSGATSQFAGFAIDNFEAGPISVSSTFASRTMDQARVMLIDLVLTAMRGLS